MYTIYADDKLLYAPHLFLEGCGVFSPRLTVELNKAGSLEFTMPTENNRYDAIQKLKTIITVYENSNEIFRGRVLHDERDFYKQRKVYAEGDLAFLLDSIQRPYNLFGKPDVLFDRLISRHNQKVDANKRFTVGRITLEFDKSTMLTSDDYPNTLDDLTNKLVSVYGGYLKTRTENDIRYIDWLKDSGRTSDQIIEFGVNLLDLTEYITAENIFTVIIPVGGELFDEEGNSLGKLGLAFPDYLENETAIALFGRIEQYVEWPDILSRDLLVSTATTYLNKNIEMAVSLTIKAIDLGLLNVDVEHIRVGDMVRVVSLPHNLDRFFQCTKIVYDLANPELTEYVFGVNFASLTEQQVNANKNFKNSLVVAGSNYVKTSTLNAYQSEVNGSLDTLRTDIDYIMGIVNSVEKTVEIIVTDKADTLNDILNTAGTLTVSGIRITSSPTNVIVSPYSVGVTYTLVSDIAAQRTVVVNGESIGVVQKAGDSVTKNINASSIQTIDIVFET